METSIPIKKITLQSISQELKPTIEMQETEDQKIATLSGNQGWESLKERLQRKIAAIDESTKITSDTMALVDDMELYGFKCMAKDLLIEAYQGVINDVEETAKFLNDKKDGESKLPTEE